MMLDLNLFTLSDKTANMSSVNVMKKVLLSQYFIKRSLSTLNSTIIVKLMESLHLYMPQKMITFC